MKAPLAGLGHPARNATGSAGFRKILRKLTSDRVLPYFLVAPAVLLVFALTIYPIIYVIGASFTDWNLTRTVTRNVGLQNYADLASDPLALRSLFNTGVFTVGSTSLILVLGLALALALNQPIRFRAFFRSAVILPWALTAVVVGVMWHWDSHPRYWDRELHA